jgi:hypothetical protein
LLTAAHFRDAFLGFRARDPDVESWIVWNEATHTRSLSAERPGGGGAILRRGGAQLRRLPVVGGDVLDISGMTASVGVFQRHARERPRICRCTTDVCQAPPTRHRLGLRLGRSARPGAPGQ